MDLGFIETNYNNYFTEHAIAMSAHIGRLEDYYTLAEFFATSGYHAEKPRQLNGTQAWQVFEWLDACPNMTPAQIYAHMYPGWVDPRNIIVW